MATSQITDSRGTVKPRGIDALFASYGDETRRMKEEAAAARKRMLSLPNVTEGHEYGKWWLCIVFAPGTSETEPRRLHWCYNQKGAEDFARDYTKRGCFCVIAQTTKQPGDDL